MLEFLPYEQTRNCILHKEVTNHFFEDIILKKGFCEKREQKIMGLKKFTSAVSIKVLNYYQ